MADSESARHKKLINSLNVPVKISSNDAVRDLGGRGKRVQPSVFYDCNPGKTDYRAASKSISNSGLEDALEFPVDFNSE
jgi:hypothetical protein